MTDDGLYTLMPGTVFTAEIQQFLLLGLCISSQLNTFAWDRNVLM